MIKSKVDLRAEYSAVVDIGSVTMAIAEHASGKITNRNCIVAMLLTCAVADAYDLSLDFDFASAGVYKALQNNKTEISLGSLTPFLLLTQHPDNDAVYNRISEWKAARTTAAYYANLYCAGLGLTDAGDFTADQLLFKESPHKYIIPPDSEISNNASNIMLRVWEKKQPLRPIAAKIVAANRSVKLHACKTVVDFFDETVYNSKLHRALWDSTVSYNYNDLQYCLSMEEKH